MSAYRFCRTDDIGLLVDALNRCWAPYVPQQPPATPAAFKRSIRDLQVWCSSCMVAFAGADPIGVLIGAKRPAGTLIHRIAVHPDHVRQGHGRHLLASLKSKLSILGPPRMVAEIPEHCESARALFRASGYAEEATLTDYVWEPGPGPDPALLSFSARSLIIPVTTDDLAANGLLEPGRPLAWERSVETLIARKDEIEGLAVASDERIEAYILYSKDGSELLALRSFIDDDRHLPALMTHLGRRGLTDLRFSRVHPTEMSRASLEALGFRALGQHLRYAATARPE